MNISTDYLKTFLALCESKSFSETSTIVHKSQSAVSAQIAKLEQEIGVKLINRVSRQFKLTEGGEIFLAYAKEILRKTDELRASIRELESVTSGEVKIGATRSVGIYVLPEIIKTVAQELPKLKLSLLSQSRIPIYELVRQRKLDFAVVLSDTVPDGFVVKILHSEPLCLVVSPDHRLAAKRLVSLKELASTPVALGVQGNEFSDMADLILQANGIPRPKDGLTISNLQGRKEAARAGAAIAILPGFAVREELQTRALIKLNVKGLQLPDTRLMLIESRERSSKAIVERVKRYIIHALSTIQR